MYCNREVKADVKSTLGLCHDQTPAIGINLCVYRVVCCVLENESISSSLDASQQVSEYKIITVILLVLNTQ